MDFRPGFGIWMFVSCVSLWSIGTALAVFTKYDKKLSVQLQSALSPAGEFSLVLKDLFPRRRLREEHVLMTVDFPGTEHSFEVVLERVNGRVTITTKEWGRVRFQHLPVKGLTEKSYHKNLFLHVAPGAAQGGGMSRMQVYLDCQWQGYFMMPLSLYQMAEEGLAHKLRAERDRKIRVQVIRNSSLQRALEEAYCAPADDQPLQPAAEFYGINGETDHLLRSLADLTSALKEMKRFMDMQTRETKMLRDSLERCELCRKVNRCHSSPCYPGVQCEDTPSGFRCGPCPRGFKGDGVACKQIVTCANKPCFEGVRCYDVENGYRCGPCPPGYTGNGASCKPANQCSQNPCWPGTQCVNVDATPGYICGPCPQGFSGNGTYCEDIDECSLARPCHPQTTCLNIAPGFRCGQCPPGYTGRDVQGVGLEYARSVRQLCLDINECDDGRNGGCVENSQCINTMGSFSCGECIEGFVGNQTYGCHPHPGKCPDGTLCDGNAECELRRGLSKYQCKCRVGWAGDGKTCGPDRDLDGWPDVNLSCVGDRCKADNCPDTPNSGQEDADRDGIGDACDVDADNDGIVNTPEFRTCNTYIQQFLRRQKLTPIRNRSSMSSAVG